MTADLRSKSYLHSLSKHLVNLLYCTREPKMRLAYRLCEIVCKQAMTKQLAGVMWPARRTEECEEEPRSFRGYTKLYPEDSDSTLIRSV
ncbi:hypothetical protein BDW75DRAFT_178060 [Aspergillus navahoensis]